METRSQFAMICLLLVGIASVLPAGDQEIDWQRAQELRQRDQRGEALTEIERAYLDRARQERRRQMLTAQAPQAKGTTGLIPLTEMGEGQYKGYTGGLYGDGQNVPSESHMTAALTQTDLIQPLDLNGVPSETGIIGLISLGMSNTTQEFSLFKKLADADPNRSHRVAIVDCAQGGQAARQWAYPSGNPDRPSPWTVMDQRLAKAHVGPNQVQVVWMKQAEINPSQYGAFPAHAQTLRDNMATILRMLQARFPNLRIAYLSSRIYAGYAMSGLNPEPYAYESAFSVRWLIEAQAGGDPNLNCDPLKGELKAPLLLWGPYLWADGLKPRQNDNLTWTRENFGPDGTHPSTSGRERVASMLMDFFTGDATSRKWFLTHAVR